MIRILDKIKLALIFIFTPLFVFADNLNVVFSLSDANPIDATNIYELIYAVLDVVIKLGAVVVVFFLVYSGFLFVTAQGNEDKISKAKGAFLWTVVGAIVLLGAFTLSEIVCNTANQLGAGVSCNVGR